MKDAFPSTPQKDLIRTPTGSPISRPAEPTFANFCGLFYARAERVVLDKQNRIRIPERLMKLASLQHEAVIVGVNDHAEVWDKHSWEQFLAGNSEQFDDLTTEALDSFLIDPPMDG